MELCLSYKFIDALIFVNVRSLFRILHTLVTLHVKYLPYPQQLDAL
jgi:hypothetical protein